MKQELISTGLAFADFVHRHPKRISAAIAILLMGGAGGAFAVASLAPTAPTEPLRLVAETVAPSALTQQAEALDVHSFTLYRSEQTRASDTPEALLKRLGLADPAAAAFLRKNETTRQALFGKAVAGRTVTAEATDRLELQTLRTRWVESADDDSFKRLVVEKSGDSFSVRIETAPLVAKAGANVLVAGSAVFKGTGVEAYRGTVAGIRQAALAGRG